MGSLAIIPARSGSKGLKDKNIKELCGKPLLTYSVEAALASGIFDVVHVSTDSADYAAIAGQCGADVPFLREDELATDTASTWDVVRSVLRKYAELGKRFDIVTVLQPTSPLRTSDDIIGAMHFFEEKRANMISSVCKMEHSPLWSNTLPDDLSMKDFEDERIAQLPRQSLPTYYRENGAIYIVRTSYLFSTDHLYQNECYAYIMSQEHSIDIDEELDFLVAQVIMEGALYEKGTN